MQKIVALSVTEAEVIAIVQCVQEMIYIMKLVESLKLKVRKPMMVNTDNKGAVDLINGWSVGGGTKHIDCRLMYLSDSCFIAYVTTPLLGFTAHYGIYQG